MLPDCDVGPGGVGYDRLRGLTSLRELARAATGLSEFTCTYVYTPIPALRPHV